MRFIYSGKIIIAAIALLLAGMQANAQQKVADSLFARSVTYEKVHDYKHALEYINLYNSYHDSIASAATNKRIQQLQQGADALKIQNTAQQQALQKDAQSHTRMKAAIGWCVVLIIVLLILAFALRQQGRRQDKQAQNVIDKQAIRIEELKKFKDKLFSVLSHDLHAPLSSLSVTMSLLDEDLLTPQEFAELKPEVGRQLASLTHLLDNLLRSSQSAAGSQGAEQVNLHRIAEQNINLLRYVAIKKKISIRNNVPKEINIKGDAGQIDIVIRNLISNAVKYTQPGGAVTLSAIRYANTTEISVHDTGVGMNTLQMEQLFKTSQNFSTHGTEGEKGIGLGLLLCYEFVKANHGNISVASELGKGSTFTIVFSGS